MKRKTRMEKGITLIALIITIVVLLILAAVAISSITNDGILSYAQNAAKDYNQAVKNEKDILQGYINFLDKKTIVDKNGNDISNQFVTSNTEAYDSYGNKIVVPAGFKIRVDASTNNADTVTEGIVIEDESGNQFVWIPVGKVYTDTAKTEANAKTITLGRYVFADGVNDLDGDGTILPAGEIVTALSVTNPSDELKPKVEWEHSCTEALKDSITGNVHARDIEAFITSATQNKGYYLGRYEAGNLNDTLVCKYGQNVYNNVTQATASSLAQGMYEDGYSTGTFSSDLINSYAWDTTIVFLQTFDNREDKMKPYSIQNSLNIGNVALTGTTTDIICNVYDMASNCWEWTTETNGFINSSCIFRGGNRNDSNTSTSTRYTNNSAHHNDLGAFRPLLYVAL